MVCRGDDHIIGIYGWEFLNRFSDLEYPVFGVCLTLIVSKRLLLIDTCCDALDWVLVKIPGRIRFQHLYKNEGLAARMMCTKESIFDRSCGTVLKAWSWLALRQDLGLPSKHTYTSSGYWLVGLDWIGKQRHGDGREDLVCSLALLYHPTTSLGKDTRIRNS